MRLTALLCAVFLPTALYAESHLDATAIVAIGGSVTEIVYALGQQDRLVARDTTSLFPQEAQDLPDVGYMRQLSAEGVLSVGPDLILTRDTAGPPEVLDQLRSASVPIVEVQDGFSKSSVIAAIQTVGAALGVPDRAKNLAASVETDFASLEAQTVGVSPKVLFILSNQGGRLNVAGADTGASGILELAGASNVMEDAFSGYKIMNDEAIIAAAPDVILMMSGQADHEARAEEILSLPAIAQTPAGRTKAFVTIDPAALGFGPRTAMFAQELSDDLAAAAASYK